MTGEAWVLDEITVSVSGVFTTYHRLETPSGVLGELTLPAFRSEGRFCTADGRELVMRRTSWWRGWHELREGGVGVGTARPRGFWRRKMDVEFRGRMYELAPVGFWARDWRLADEAGVAILEVRPRGAFRRGARIKILGPIDTDLLAFTYYLVNARWQEEGAAAAAAASS